MSIGKDIWLRLEKAGILSKGMSKEERKQAIRKAGPYKLMSLGALGIDKAYILLHYAKWKISKEELKKVYQRLDNRTKLDHVKATKKSKQRTKKIDVAKIISNKRQREIRQKQIRKSKTYQQKLYNIYKDKITCVFRYNIHQDKGGNYRVFARRTQEREKYLFHGFRDDSKDNIVLIECPPDVMAIEFEEDATKKDCEKKSIREEREKWTKQTYENAKKLGIDGCVVSHGGTSDYFYAFNLNGLPEDNEKNAKKALAEIIVPKPAKDFIDWTNLGKTLIPIIGRPHWKPKYEGTIHKIMYGKDPLKHESHVERILANKVKEKPTLKYDDITEEIRRQAPLRSLLIKYGYDVSRNPTMCRLGHGSKGEACFSYDEDKGLWNCFHCGNGGTIFNLVMQHENVSFEEAKRIVAKEFGIKIDEMKIKADKIIDKSPIERMKKRIGKLKKK